MARGRTRLSRDPRGGLPDAHGGADGHEKLETAWKTGVTSPAETESSSTRDASRRGPMIVRNGPRTRCAATRTSRYSRPRLGKPMDRHAAETWRGAAGLKF